MKFRLGEEIVDLLRMEGTQFVVAQRLEIQSFLCDELVALKKSSPAPIPLIGESTTI